MTLRIRNETRATTLGGSIETANGLMGKFRGLMGRPALVGDTGLWLPGSNGIHMMFMRFPIDAVFLGRPDQRSVRSVVAIRSGLRPWTGVVWLVRGADGVVELPVGTIAATSTAVGDRVLLETV
jgi:uncharacterized protein